MKKLMNAIEVNGNDGILGALGKGMLKGTIKSATTMAAIGLGCIIADRLSNKGNTSEEEVGE